jgi:hypothetical protein
MGREELRGRAAGITVCAVMGLTWAFSATGALGPVAAAAVLVAGLAIVAVLMTGARRLRRQAGAMPDMVSAGVDVTKVRRRFALVLVGEGAAIAAAINVLVRWGHTEWIPAVICAAVGLHFVPLARMFGVPLYYATAAALCLVAATTMALGAAGAPVSLWRLLPGFGAALALWTTGARLRISTTGPTVRR